jgi:hypothetical protein
MADIEVTEDIGGLRRYLAAHVTMRQQQDWMKDPSWHYIGIEDFVLKEGQPFLEFSEDQPKLGERNRYKPRIPRQCYDNSYRAVLASKGRLRYVEGYAYTGSLPVLHAWNIDPDGKIVDTTWCGDGNTADGHFYRPAPGSAYMGVIFPVEYVRNMRTKFNTSMIDQWEKNWPVLRQEWRVG